MDLLLAIVYLIHHKLIISYFRELTKHAVSPVP